MTVGYSGGSYKSSDSLLPDSGKRAALKLQVDKVKIEKEHRASFGAT
ncbi:MULTISPECIES: hypothetical protein [Bacteroides]|nr:MULTISPECIES: hypothetical protein [Bacteroides]EXY31320.1 hypothetical protein M080_6407 [Bacteroides fragilis str. 3397 T10]MCE8780916.1 hypothetical protein [Bacteroides thetaiotaomicron]